MYSGWDLHKGGVAPFGHPRINDRSHLPAAFRSVPRPSSPLGAKASTERPSHTHPSPPARRTNPHPKRHAPSPHVQRTATQHRDTLPWQEVSPPGHSISPSDSPVKEHGSPRRQRRQNGVFRKPRRDHVPADLFSTLWRRSDSNRRPPACKAGALPLSYAPSRELRQQARTRPKGL